MESTFSNDNMHLMPSKLTLSVATKTLKVFYMRAKFKSTYKWKQAYTFPLHFATVPVGKYLFKVRGICPTGVLYSSNL